MNEIDWCELFADEFSRRKQSRGVGGENLQKKLVFLRNEALYRAMNRENGLKRVEDFHGERRATISSAKARRMLKPQQNPKSRRIKLHSYFGMLTYF